MVSEVTESLQLALVLQKTGYYSRLSFDTVLVHDEFDKVQIHWIECNGRWGSVSIPMTYLNRLLGDYRRKSFVIMQNNIPQQRTLPFLDTKSCLENLLFKRDAFAEGLILTLPDAANLTSKSQQRSKTELAYFTCDRSAE